MYKYGKPAPTTIRSHEGYEGETIEAKIRRIVNNKEPVTDGAPMIYTERKDGVKAAFNIRTDRFEIAVDAMDKVTKSHLAKREQRHNPKDEPDLGKKAAEGMIKEGQSPANTSDKN